MTSIIVVLAPGTGVIYTLSIGLSHGQKASLAAALGCTIGILPHLLASILGLSFLLQMNDVLFQTLKWIGTIYLIYIAWTMWSAVEKTTFKVSFTENFSVFRVIVKAILLNLLNPKLTTFFFAFLPVFIAPDSPSPHTELIRLSSIFMAITLTVFSVYGVLASGIRQRVVHSSKQLLWIRRSCAVLLAIFGLRLALARQ